MKEKILKREKAFLRHPEREDFFEFTELNKSSVDFHKGLATEAIALVVKFAFGDLELHRIEANIQPQNFASLAVAKKNGFMKEGFSPKYLQIDGE